jgi:lipopolysaccharide transport system ATP-binding protein
MTDIAIHVENLSKRYRIGLKDEIHDTFVGAVTDFVRRPLINLRRLRRLTSFEGESQYQEDVIWALKDVSFDVDRGEVLGIIGRNGAGKSTLLKVLSRITHPTTGRVEMRGRISSLLEVGTGFHHELTGRENIYLNGTILGMTKAEVDRKYDEIVEFSGVEKFIDTPVKHYSSGMRVRLAFSVAAHLEPEILLVDEVLAVGDVEFQQKSLGKMSQVAKGGRTVLFVSHNMAAINALCHRTLYLDDGIITRIGETEAVVREYMHQAYKHAQNAGQHFPVYNQEYGIGINDCVVNIDQNQENDVSLKITLSLEAAKPVRKFGVGIRIKTVDGASVSMVDPYITGDIIDTLDGKCRYTLLCEKINQYLSGGEYILDVWLEIPNILYLVRVNDAILFNIPAQDVYGCGKPFVSSRNGIVPIPMQISRDSI